MPTPSTEVRPSLRAVLEIWREVVMAFVRSDGTELHPHQAMSVAVHLLDQTPPDPSADLNNLINHIQASAFAQRHVGLALTHLLEK